MNSKINLFICAFLFFFGFIHLKAQESKEILELKNKLALAKSDKDLVKNYSLIINTYLKNRNIDSTICYQRKILPLYEKLGKKEDLLYTDVLMANLYLSKGNIVDSKKIIDKVTSDVNLSSDYKTKSIYNHTKAFLLSFEKKSKEAIQYFNKNIEYYKSGKKVDKIIVMFAYQGFFSNAFQQGEIGKSYEAVNTYVDFVKKNFPKRLNEAYNMEALGYMLADEYDKCIDSYKKSLTFTKKDDTTFIGIINGQIATSYLKLNKIDSAKYFAFASEGILKNTKNKNDLTRTYLILSEIFAKEKNYNQAEIYANKSLEYAPKEDIESSVFRAKNSIYSIQLEKLLKDSLSIKGNSEKRIQLQEILNKLMIL